MEKKILVLFMPIVMAIVAGIYFMMQQPPPQEPEPIKTLTERPAIKASYKGVICPKCLETGCIYEEIDSRTTTGTDADIQNVIYQIGKELKLTPEQIEMLLTEYYL